ncbi:glycerate kinase [Streptococcus sp. zg-JUN1979]|uniref:glycerate kinase n=1 Tax=Streptococcus sp. zg-JUN1979 TaxID=3391450 RepID=UPI0039A4E592
MHIVLAPDSFKESLSAMEVAKALQQGLAKALPHATFDAMPIGDGGEGTLAALADGLGLTYDSHDVTGPFGQTIKATYAQNEEMAVFEMADICGLEMVEPARRNPLKITTRGVGEMIIHLLEQGISDIMVGVGGSSSIDGGLGMAKALGYCFLDASGREVEPVGDSLSEIYQIDSSHVSPLLEGLSLTIITDVSHVLCGKQGATYTFGHQKGLPFKQFEQVDRAMERLYKLIDPTILSRKGSGAGGGMAAGLVTFAKGQIVSGIDAVLDMVNCDERMTKADLVIVGEGRLDRQSLAGKAPVGVARRVPKGTPVVAICGSISEEVSCLDYQKEGICAAFSIIERLESLENTLKEAKPNLIRTAENIGHLLSLSYPRD